MERLEDKVSRFDNKILNKMYDSIEDDEDYIALDNICDTLNEMMDADYQLITIDEEGIALGNYIDDEDLEENYLFAEEIDGIIYASKEVERRVF